MDDMQPEPGFGLAPKRKEVPLPGAVQRPSPNGCVELQAGEGLAAPTIYFVHGLDGEIFGAGPGHAFADLVPLLSPCRSVLLEFDETASRCETLPELAELYLDRLRSDATDAMRNPGRGIFIGGYGFGCIIAHQMALQMQEFTSTDEVGSVSLLLLGGEVAWPRLQAGEISRRPLGTYPWLGAPIEAALRIARRYGEEGLALADALVSGLVQRPERERSASKVQMQVYWKLAGPRGMQFENFCYAVKAEFDGARTMEKLHALLCDSEPLGAFEGKSLLVLAEGSPEFYAAASVNARYCSKLETVLTPGTHYNMMESEERARVAADRILAFAALSRVAPGLHVLRDGIGPRFYVCTGHGLSGSSDVSLAEHLQGCYVAQPVYDDEAFACDTLPELCAEYKRRIMLDIGEGAWQVPVYICGYSFGCVVAHQMALQFQEAGLDIGLVLFDSEVTWPPTESADGRDRIGEVSELSVTISERNRERINLVAGSKETPWRPPEKFRGDALLVVAPGTEDCSAVTNAEYCSNLEIATALGTHSTILGQDEVHAAADAVHKFAWKRGHWLPILPEADDAVPGLTVLHNGDGPRVYTVHGLDGGHDSYRSLAERLGPCYVAAMIYDDEAYSADSLKELAAIYLRRILQDARQNHRRPLFVCGYSSGCVIAHQIASQAEEAGEPMHLVLYDYEVTFPPNSDAGSGNNLERVGGYRWLGGEVEAAALLTRNFLARPGTIWVKGELEKLLALPAEACDNEDFRDRCYAEILKSPKWGRGLLPEETWRSMCATWARRMNRLYIQETWTPQRILEGDALLVVAPDSPEFHGSIEVNKKYCSNLEIVWCLGTHYTMLGAELVHVVADRTIKFMQRLGCGLPDPAFE